MTIRVVESPRLGVHTEAWDELSVAADLPTPFTRSWWLEAVGRSTPCFVLVLDDDVLIGGLALERGPIPGIGHYRLLGAGKLCPDHLDLLADRAHHYEVAAALRDWFRSGSRLLDLDGLRDGALMLDALPGVRVEPTDVAPHESLPSSMDDYLAARSSSFGKRARRTRRRLEQRGVSVRQASSSEVAVVMDVFGALHAVREDRSELMQHYASLRRAVERGARAGEVELWLAEGGGQIGAVMVVFIAAGRVNVYQMARSMDPLFNHVGIELYLTALEAAIQRGRTDFDFLRGSEPFKYSFVGSQRHLVRARAAHGARARIALAALLAFEQGRAAAGRLRARWRERREPRGRVTRNTQPAGS